MIMSDQASLRLARAGEMTSPPDLVAISVQEPLDGLALREGEQHHAHEARLAWEEHGATANSQGREAERPQEEGHRTQGVGLQPLTPVHEDDASTAAAKAVGRPMATADSVRELGFAPRRSCGATQDRILTGDAHVLVGTRGLVEGDLEEDVEALRQAHATVLPEQEGVTEA